MAIAIPFIPAALDALGAACMWVGGTIMAAITGKAIGHAIADHEAEAAKAEQAAKDVESAAKEEPKTEVGSCETCGNDDDNNSGKQDKKLSKGEIKKLKDNDIDPHDLKPKYEGSKYDLFKNKDGDILVKPKDGSGVGDPTGININEL